MRGVSLTLSIVLPIAACSAPITEPVPVRPDRQSLIAQADQLGPDGVTATEEGPWQLRNLARHRSPAPDSAGSAGTEIATGLAAAPTTVTPTGESVDTFGTRGGGGGAVERMDVGRPTGPTGGAVLHLAEGKLGLATKRSAKTAKPDDTVVLDSLDGTTRAGERGERLRESLARTAHDASPLRAGSTDDNLDHGTFVKYLADKNDALKGRCQFLDVADRRSIRVVDRSGKPLPGASITIVDEDRDKIVWRGTTYGDGSFPFYPSLLAQGTPETLLLEVRHGDRFLRQHWNGAGEECSITLPRWDAELDAVELDVVFLIDTTGSMSDEIEAIKATLLSVTAKLDNLDREFDLRYGAVLYRDISDAYVTKAHPFTDDLDAFDAALQKIEANGGGDTPESLNQGLAVAIDGMEWRAGAAKLVFLIADAPAHIDYENDVPYGDSLEAAVARGVRIHAVAASGLDDAGTLMFRQMAHFTRGKFIFIEYGGSTPKTAESHGVTGKVKRNNLDDILFEQIRDEVAQWGRVSD